MENLKSDLFSKFRKSELSGISHICGGIKYTKNQTTGTCDTSEGEIIKVTKCDLVGDGGDSHPDSSWK